MKTEFRFQRNLRPFCIRDFDVAGGADPFDHLRDRLLITLHLHLHRLIPAVSHPAGQSELVGSIIRPVTEPHALQLALENHIVTDFFFFVSSVWFRCLVHISLPPNSHCLKFVCRRTVQRKREPVGWNVLPDFRWNLASLTCQR